MLAVFLEVCYPGRPGISGLTRPSSLEIVTKLCDVDFARKAKAADFLGRAWEVLREAGAGDGDKVRLLHFHTTYR